LTSALQARQKLESQQQENKNVQAEFALLKDDANIYKLVGPVLLKQDKTEAVMAVDGRLNYIEKEIERVEKQIKEIQEKSEKKKMEVCLHFVLLIALELMVSLITDIRSADADAARAAGRNCYFMKIKKVQRIETIALSEEMRLPDRELPPCESCFLPEYSKLRLLSTL